VQVSSKVSYSVLVFLERQGVQLESFFENLDTPVELFRDPSCWIPIDKMEEFLKALTNFTHQPQAFQFLREVGQKNHELRAWGVLDSVLKMVESPKDIFLQPERFLSYFLTPHPELQVTRLEGNQILVSLQRPPQAHYVHSYLVGAIEGLPTYTGRPQALIENLDTTTFKMTWFDDQQSLFDEQESKRRQFHPEIVHSVLESIKQQHIHQTENPGQSLEEEKKVANEAFEKMVSHEVEKRLGDWLERMHNLDETIFKIKNDFFKMYDYFTRAQQIITLVTPTARKASVREAMRRVDWDYVQKEFPRLVEGACDSILSIKDQINTRPEPVELDPVDKKPTDINQLIDSVVESLPIDGHGLKLDRHWLFDKPVHVDTHQMTRVLEDILKTSVSKLERQGEIKLTTRPLGSRMQIEITDNGTGFAAEDLEVLFDQSIGNNLYELKKIIQDHQGEISVSSRRGVGSTYLIELPI
jgi:signal transduction histidine kinase